MKKLLFLVEDDADIRESLKDFLIDEGYDVLTAENGFDALNQLRLLTDLPKLILLDLMMPVMDGVSFRTAQLLDPRLSNIPVVVTSANPQGTQKLSAMGVHDFIKKPPTLDLILEVIRKYS
jgi:two-component system chemotaxis response regulator CheY